MDGNSGRAKNAQRGLRGGKADPCRLSERLSGEAGRQPGRDEPRELRGRIHGNFIQKAERHTHGPRGAALAVFPIAVQVFVFLELQHGDSDAQVRMEQQPLNAAKFRECGGG